jgi:hypothetical protein
VEDETIRRNFTMVESGDGYAVVSWNEFEGEAYFAFYPEFYSQSGYLTEYEYLVKKFLVEGKENRHRLDLEPGLIYEGEFITW